MNNKTDYVASLVKGLKILECFNAEKPKLSVADAAQLSGLDRAAARRYLLTLSQEDYLEYDGKFFSPKIRTLRLGTGAIAALPLPRIVQPWLDSLSDNIGESVSVATLDGNEIVYLARAARQRIMSIGLQPGSRLPAHCTSMGRSMLAYLPAEEAKRIVETSDLSPRTQFSKTGVDEIMDELDRVQTQGYALVDQEVEIGLRSLAVPIVDKFGVTIAALNTGVAALQPNAQQLPENFLGDLLRVKAGLRRLL